MSGRKKIFAMLSEVFSMSKTMLVLLLLAFPLVVAAQQHITPAEAQNHIGQTATVCGRVASLH